MSDSPSPETPAMPSPLRCVLGAIVSGGISFVLYNLTTSIAQAFAAKALPTGNITTINIAIAVRTLVTGLSALGTFIFGLAAIGLFGLGIQLLLGKDKSAAE